MANQEDEDEEYQIRSDLGQYNSSNGNDSAEAISTKKPGIISNFRQAISENIAKLKEEKAKRDAEAAELKLLEEEAKSQAKAEKAQIKEEQDYENKEIKKAQTYETAYDKELRRKELSEKLALAAGNVTESAQKLVAGVSKFTPPTMATGKGAIRQTAMRSKPQQPMFGTPNYSGFVTTGTQPNYSGFGTGSVGVPLIGIPANNYKTKRQKQTTSSIPPLFSFVAQRKRNNRSKTNSGGQMSFVPPLFGKTKKMNYSFGYSNKSSMPSLFGKPSKKKKSWQL